jgi:pSer/pThr/pTyr-binding forkhead associated (FHA) protein
MEPRHPTDFQSTGTITVPGNTSAPADPAGERPGWVDAARAGLDEPGRWLAYAEDGVERVVPLAREWTRIGRSLAADVRFDDATVSRRHALLVAQADGVRVLDDRSLNGVYVNGRRVEWSALGDGDRITVGRHTLWFLDSAATPAATTAATTAGGD